MINILEKIRNLFKKDGIKKTLDAHNVSMDNFKIIDESTDYKINNIIAFNTSHLDIRSHNEIKRNNNKILFFDEESNIKQNNGNSIIKFDEITISNTAFDTEFEFNDFKDNLETLLFSSEIELGKFSDFDKFVIDNIEKEYTLKAISKIYVENYDSEEILTKILNAISEVDYRKVGEIGEMIAISSVANKSLIVKQKAIETFEKWNYKGAITILENLDIREQWLKNYINKIINNLKEDKKYA